MSELKKVYIALLEAGDLPLGRYTGEWEKDKVKFIKEYSSFDTETYVGFDDFYDID